MAETGGQPMIAGMEGLPAKRKHLFYVELEKLVEAGFGIKEAASVLLENRPSRGERKLLDELLAGLAEGRSIAESFQGGELTQMERGIIAAGERGGKLGPAFKHLADRLKATAKEGNALGPVFVAERAFPRAFAKSYATAEESGMLDKDLLRWAKVFEDDAASSVRTLSVVLPKLGYALIVCFVVWKLVSFYSGYYGSLEELGL